MFALKCTSFMTEMILFVHWISYSISFNSGKIDKMDKSGKNKYTAVLNIPNYVGQNIYYAQV